jgi:hypothetical protein
MRWISARMVTGTAIRRSSASPLEAFHAEQMIA